MPRSFAAPLIPPRGLPVLMDTGQIVPTSLLSTTPGTGRFRVQHVGRRTVPATPLLVARLGPLQEVLLTEQLGVLDGQPLYLRVGYLRLDLVDAELLSQRMHRIDTMDPKPDVAGAVRALFDRELGGTSTTVESVPCERDTADLLGVPPGAPVLLRELLVRDADDLPLEVSFTHYRGDRIVLESRTAPDARDGYPVVRRDATPPAPGTDRAW